MERRAVRLSNALKQVLLRPGTSELDAARAKVFLRELEEMPLRLRSETDPQTRDLLAKDWQAYLARVEAFLAASGPDGPR